MASIIWGIFLVLITEALSFFHNIKLFSFFGAWLLVFLLASVFILFNCHIHEIQVFINKECNKCVKLLKINKFVGFSLLSIILVVSLALFLALISPPNNWDSMTYHMSRVVNWLQNQSLEHYPTHNLRQIDSPPWSSLAILNLQVLSQGDHLANIVQWSSMVGCLIGISLISQQLGANWVGQILSAVICLSIPMGLLQSVTTQNDYVVSFWLVCFVYHVLLGFEQKVTLQTTLFAGLSLGLALLTKGTAYIYALPFGVMWLITILRFCPKNKFINIFTGLVAIILINAPHWLRNIQVFNTPLGLSGDITKNKLFTLTALLSNLTRNLSLHLLPPLPSFNTFVQELIIGFHQNVLKIEVSDPRTTFQGTIFKVHEISPDRPFFFHEDISGNFFQLLLFCFALGLFIFYRRTRNYQLKNYIYVLAVILVLINILLAWQPWGSRLHLPFFVFLSAFTGTVISRLTHKIIIFYFLVFFLTISSFPPLVFSAARPLLQSNYVQTFSPSIFELTREEIMFTMRKELKTPYIKALQLINDKKCYDIGLYMGGDSWEYPLWAIAKQETTPVKVRFRAVNVGPPLENISGNATQNYLPCAVLVIDRPEIGDKISLVDPTTKQVIQYSQERNIQEVRIFSREQEW
jgi:hypothetical protein